MSIKGVTKTKTQYAIEIDDEDLLKILKDDADIFKEDDFVPLVEHLDAIPGIGQIMYSGHFGHYIYLMIDDDLDNEETWNQIREQITIAINQ